VDGSFVEANAAKESRIPRRQLTEAAQVNHTVRQYLVELEEQNPVEEPVHQQDQVSTTDPDSTYATKGGTPARLGYYDNYLVDNHSCVIVGVQATAARMSQETVAAQGRWHWVTDCILTARMARFSSLRRPLEALSNPHRTLVFKWVQRPSQFKPTIEFKNQEAPLFHGRVSSANAAVPQMPNQLTAECLR
jgi:hypothetical protein